MIRKIVEINDEKCNGCGACVNACHEGAIGLVNGKAKLLSDTYCDGLGACLPECPTGAISIIERESRSFDEAAAKQHVQSKAAAVRVQPVHHGCPGSAMRSLQPEPAAAPAPSIPAAETASELKQWPVQIRLVNVRAPYFQNCDLLIAADCTAYAFANFHQQFIRGRVTLIGCPKLDDNEYYTQKLTEILAANEIRSITVVRMEVPCCGGIVQAVKKAMLNNQLILPYNEIVISVEGKILNN